MVKETENLQIRQIKQGDWYWVSRSVTQKYGPKIGILALGVYHFLASMADDEQRCFPSQQFIASHLGCARSSVNQVIKKLEKNALISITKENRHYIYYLLEPQVSDKTTASVQQTYTNDTKLINNGNDIYSVRKLLQKQTTHKEKTRNEQLAYELADSLNDHMHFYLYLQYTHKYPEQVLREFLSHVKQTPIHKIKKSRGAFFTYLINNYEKRN